jgi:hypothetical protein|tara:strand:- start:3084 stop:3614 length:531 start_codon:yes stop_codon:yes gene_type:complete
MIERRQSGFVTTNGLVPVDTICSAIGKGKTLDALTRVYPKLTHEDIYEAIHFYSDNTNIPMADTDKILQLVNVGKGAQDTVIEVTNLHQVVYIKLVASGHYYYPQESNFAKLMNQGLRICCLDNVVSVEEGKDFDSELHVLVNEALHRAVPDILTDIERTKKDLDYDEYIQRRNND